jgi:hypothetical protein
VLSNNALERTVNHRGRLCSQWIACSPGRNGRHGRPLNWVVRLQRNVIAMAGAALMKNASESQRNPQAAPR